MMVGGATNGFEMLEVEGRDFKPSFRPNVYHDEAI